MPSWDKQRGIWRAQIKLNGQRYRASFPTKKEAKDWEVQKRRELLEVEKNVTTTAMDLETFFNKYLDYAKLHFVDKTYKNKQRLCRRLLKHSGNISVQGVTTALLDDYLTSQALTRSRAGFNEDYKHIRSMWSWGTDFLEFSANPALKLRRIPQDRAPQYTPSTEDILKVMAAATREELVFLNCYLQTGARRSEIFRWTWVEDINFDKREVRLTSKKTKDGSSDSQWLPMNDDLYDELWWWWKNRPIKNTPYVFVSTCNRHYGKPFTTRRRFMKGLCKRAGVTPFEFHALRRYVASVLADTHKVSAKRIQRILRHKSVTTTERYIQNINQDLAGTLNLLSGKGPHEGSPKVESK
jgi:integrase